MKPVSCSPEYCLTSVIAALSEEDHAISIQLCLIIVLTTLTSITSVITTFTSITSVMPTAALAYHAQWWPWFDPPIEWYD